MKWRIASRFAVIFSLLVLLATATVGYMVYYSAKQSLIAAATHRLAHSAEIIDVRFSAGLEAIGKDVRFLAETPPVQGVVRARNIRRKGYNLDPETAISDAEWRAQLADIFTVFLQNRRSYVQARLIERVGGHELVRVEKREDQVYRVPGGRLQSTRARDYFGEVIGLPRGGLYLSEIQLSRELDEVEMPVFPAMRAAIPVYASNGDVFGLVDILVDLRPVLNTLRALATEDKALYITSEGGRFLVHPDSSKTFGAGRGGDDLFRDMFPQGEPHLGREGGYVRVEDVDLASKTTNLTYFARMQYDRGVGRDGLLLVVTSPHATILSGVKRVRDRSLLITLLFSIGGIALTLGFSGFLTRPLSQITQSIARFGHEGWGAALPVRRRDEIGVLARAFDTMARQIQHQMQELEDKEHRQRIILETSAEGIVVTDAHGIIETFNPAAERVFGYRADEAIGHDIHMLIGEPGRSNHYAHHRRYPAPDPWRRVGSGREIVGRRKDGSLVSLSLSVSAFELSGEQKFAGFVQDITERKQYEEALEQAKEQAEEMARLKSAFLANMSHEIRTPLTSVIGYASVLAKEVSEEHRRFAELIKQSGRRLMDTLNSVLALAQLEASRVEVALDVVDVHEEALEIVQLFQPLAEQKGLALLCRVAPGAEQAKARLDRGALSSILQNLIGNAIKFTKEGRVAVLVEVDAASVVLKVQDTGVGIDAAFLPHLFDAFRQESTGLSRSHEGNGLGLSITQRLVRLMRGTITVESEKDKGSTFAVSFPRVVGEAVPAGPPEEDAGSALSKLTRARLLLVEDNADTAALMQHLLQDVCEVTCASSAEEALREAGQRRYDLVFMDINLGYGPNGVDVLRALRARPAYRDAPIAALTAYALPGDAERFLAEGFSTYLSKPFTAEDLLQLTSNLLVH